MSDSVIVSSLNSTLLITLNRPEKRNALDSETIEAILAALRETRDDASLRVLVLQGEGDAFCAGADLGYLVRIAEDSPIGNAADSRRLMEMFHALRTWPKPTIAKVHGPALAGGCGLALACDIVVADDEAKFGFTEVRIGFVPAVVMKLLIERVGIGNARELLLRGNIIDADTAQQIGRINYVVGVDELDTMAERLATEIATKTSPQAVRLTKQLLDEIADSSLDEAMRHASVFNALSRTTDDFRTGVASFLNKQRPSW